MRMMISWIPPMNWNQNDHYYFKCGSCNQDIKPSQIIAVDDHIYARLGKDHYLSGIRCLPCEMQYSGALRETINSMVRAELKKIIKEEIHDPKGPFSPEDSF